MPELPEVEVVKRSLERKISNLIIKNVEIRDGKLRYELNKEDINQIKGKKIIKIQRRSKFLIFEIGKNFFMLVHLGMTGKFFIMDGNERKFKTSFYYNINPQKDKKHDKVIFYLEKKKKLIYNDVRKFGFIKFYNYKKLYKSFHLINLGVEPLDKEFNLSYFKKYINGRDRNIKDILMDQKFISGIGNIYANEVLFASGVRPTRRVVKLSDFEINKIVRSIKKILSKSIRLGGSSIKDFSSDDGKKGVFQQYFKVYGRKGERCSNTDCNNKVMRIVISNRSSFFCNQCQK